MPRLHLALRFLLAALVGAAGKHFAGDLTLDAGKASVVAKFCFDSHHLCPPGNCSVENTPGRLNVSIRVVGPNADPKQLPANLFLSMLDDEFQSFPEASQVWSELGCDQVKKFAKASHPLKFDAKGVANLEQRVIEHLRPRFWYLALVSCASEPVQLSFEANLHNPLRGSQSELSMDEVGVGWVSFTLSGLLLLLAGLQVTSAIQWTGTNFRRNTLSDLARHAAISRYLLRLHPALVLLTFCAVGAAAGEISWLMHFWSIENGSAHVESWAMLGRTLKVVSRALLSLLLMMLASGQCVCTPDISWDEHREMVYGLAAFGAVSLGLETWGDSDLRTTTTEYIYDTRAGSTLVGLDCVLLYIYTSRCLGTWRSETRIKPRGFYWTYAPFFALWFAALPVVAVVAAQLDAWVRFKVTYCVNGAVLASTLAVLVFSFQPHIAPEVYELSRYEYMSVSKSSLDTELEAQDDDFL